MKAEIFQRTNPLAVHGHCRSTHAEAILAQCGTISVNFMRLAQFGAAICVCIKTAQLAQESHPFQSMGSLIIFNWHFRLYIK